MSDNITLQIGYNIKKFRDGAKLSQKDLAEKMEMTRPGISNWETGKSDPSASQLVKLSKIFGVSIDEIVGNMTDPRSAVIVDTSALIKRPSILGELKKNFDEVIIPEVVISELNAIKDNGKPSVKQKAWLVMVTVEENRDSFVIKSNVQNEGINDEKIAAIAINRAKSNPWDEVYILSDDVLFQFLTSRQKNLLAITPAQYAEKFQLIEKKYDPIKTIEFCSLVKSKNLKKVKNFDTKDIDINIHNPDDGLTPLIIAVRNQDIPMIEHLLTMVGIDLDILDKYKYGFSAVHHATQLKNLKIIKKLVDAGADFDLGSNGKNKGNTPLMVAAWSGFTTGVEYFLSQNASTNQQDTNGYTPLIKACIKHDYEIVKKLISTTDLSIRSRENKKAIEYLNPNNKKSLDIIKLFQEVDCDR